MLTVALTPDGAPGVARFDSRFPPEAQPAAPAVTPMPDRAPSPVAPPAASQLGGGSSAAHVPGGPVATLVTTPPTPPAPAVGVKLRVIRGLRMNAEYPVYPGRNVVGRFADRPVDIDLTGVEPDGQVWSSRKHAALTLDRGLLVVEDLNSLNGTWVNGTRLRAGVALPLKAGDVIQIGVAQLRVDVESA
jgi:hypothetical protein